MSTFHAGGNSKQHHQQQQQQQQHRCARVMPGVSSPPFDFRCNPGTPPPEQARTAYSVLRGHSAQNVGVLFCERPTAPATLKATSAASPLHDVKPSNVSSTDRSYLVLIIYCRSERAVLACCAGSVYAQIRICVHAQIPPRKLLYVLDHADCVAPTQENEPPGTVDDTDQESTWPERSTKDHMLWAVGIDDL